VLDSHFIVKRDAGNSPEVGFLLKAARVGENLAGVLRDDRGIAVAAGSDARQALVEFSESVELISS